MHTSTTLIHTDAPKHMHRHRHTLGHSRTHTHTNTHLSVRDGVHTYSILRSNTYRCLISAHARTRTPDTMLKLITHSYWWEKKQNNNKRFQCDEQSHRPLDAINIYINLTFHPCVLVGKTGTYLMKFSGWSRYMGSRSGYTVHGPIKCIMIVIKMW